MRIVVKMNDYISNISSIESAPLQGETISLVIRSGKDEFTLEIDEVRGVDASQQMAFN